MAGTPTECQTQQADHLANLAMTPGWWQYARARARELEQDDTGLWHGLVDAVRERIKAAGYRPKNHEMEIFD